MIRLCIEQCFILNLICRRTIDGAHPITASGNIIPERATACPNKETAFLKGEPHPD